MNAEQFPLSPEVRALQLLIARCPCAEARKDLIVMAGACEAITREEACLMISAYQLETA